MQQFRYSTWAAALVIGLLTAAVYAPGLHGPFVFDDLTNILQIPGIRIADLSYHSLREAWHARDFDDLFGRPLAMVSFALNYYFTQFDVFYFKLTNLVVHLLVGVALYLLALQLLQRVRFLNPDCPYAPHHLHWLALATTAVWLIHPLNLTSVLYVVQRMTSLSALFMVLGLIGYCLGREQVIRGDRKGFITIPVSLAAGALLGILFKENAVLILPLAILIEVAFYRLAADPRLSVAFHRFWFIALLVPLVVAVAAILFEYERWFGPGAYRFREFGLEERALTQARVLWFYLRMILVPDVSRMGLYHDDFPVSDGLLSPWTTLPALVGVAVLFVTALVYRTRQPVLFFAIGWFLIGHSLESTVLPLEMIHEHRNYLPQFSLLLGALYVIGAPSVRFVATMPWRLGFLGLFAVLLAVCTYQRSLQWQSEASLYPREVLNHPQSVRAQTMLGAWLHAYGSHELALKHLAIAAELSGTQADPLIRLVQHVYVTNRGVPPPLLEELRRRLLEGQLSPVTLWVFEPLLLVSRHEPVWHDRFIGLYAGTISRPDVRFSRNRYEATYRILAENHAYRGRIDAALRYYEKARAINPHPRYDIAVAGLYADSACYRQAAQVVSALRERTRELPLDDEERLEEVEARLARHDDTGSHCAL